MKPIIKEIYQNSKFKNSGTIKLILDSFSKDENIRSSVARNPSSSISTLDYLSKDKDENVRSGVAENPRSSSSTLDYLSKDENKDVRSNFARNKNAPSYILEEY